MTGPSRAVFDGWKLGVAADTDVDGAELVFSTAPTGEQGLLVRGLDDAGAAALPHVRALLVQGGALGKRGMATLLAPARGLERLALSDMAEIGGGFEAAAASALTALWIAAPAALPLRVLKPLIEAKRLSALFLDGSAPASLVRWLAALPALARLDLSRPRDDAEVGPGIAALAGLAGLAQLGLRRAHVTDAVLRRVAALPALRRLDLAGSSVGATPARWRALRHLTELRLRDVRRLDGALAALEGFDALTLLDCRGTNLAPKHFDRLRAALPNARILVDAAGAPARSPQPGPAAAPPPRARTPAPAPPTTPLRWPDDAPTMVSLHVVFPDERGAPNGFDRRFDLDAMARRFHPRHLIDGLPPTASADVKCAGLVLLPAAIRAYDPDADLLTDDALATTRALLGDDDGVDWRWGGQHQTFRFVVGALAGAAALTLAYWRAQRRGTTLADDAELLRAVLRAELARERGAPWSVAAHLLERARDTGITEAVERWLGWLAEVMGDLSASPRARVAALERFDKDRERLPEPLRASVDAAWRRQLDALARDAASPMTEMHFRRAARRLVAARAPDLLDAMRGAGELPSRALPPYARLVDGLGSPAADRVLAQAPDIDGATCVAALEGGDVALWFSALAFAPHCGDAQEARAAALLAASLVGRGERLALADAPTTESAPLGDVAAGALAALVRAQRVPTDGLLERVLEALRALPLDVRLVTPPGALVATGALSPKGEVPPMVIERFLARETSAAERFLWLQLWFPLRRGHAQRIVEDAHEDGELRALVGCLSDLVQPADAPPLPLCEPSSTVTTANLCASLALGCHQVSVRRATQVLVSRLLPWDEQGEALASGADALRAVPMPEPLRAIADGAPGWGRLAAARWLAIVGDGDDEARLAQVMVDEGGWTPRRPQGVAPATPIARLMAALVNETVVDHCESDFEPLLAIGFGDERARRVLAKAYVLIARRHAAADRVALARRSAAYAATLDALNLDVARLERALR